MHPSSQVTPGLTARVETIRGAAVQRWLASCVGFLLLLMPTDHVVAQLAVDDASTAAMDSLMVTPADSSEAGPLLLHELPQWAGAAQLSAARLDAAHPEGLGEAAKLLPGVSVRTAGGRGAASYLSLGPVVGAAPEIYVDGIPTRNPADLDPGIYDRSSIGLRAASVDRGQLHAGGPMALHFLADPALPGRSYVRTHFSSTDRETYYRGVSVSTPRAARGLRFDYEEWKTEEGYDETAYLLAFRPSGFGRAKMRRFGLSADTQVKLGRLVAGFGRGRRFHRGRIVLG